MAEDSALWTTGSLGDGTATITQADWSDILKVVAACMDNEGVAPGYLNALVGSVPGANTARIGTGGGVVDGKPYWNTAAVDVTIPSASGGGNTRIDRVVLRASWAAATVRITRIAGVDAASPTAPAITQTAGTTYDILLYQALVNTSGTVTLTDERTLASRLRDSVAVSVIGRASATVGEPADIQAGTNDKVLARSGDVVAFQEVTAAMIANRTRTFLVPAVPNEALGHPDNYSSQLGVIMADNLEASAYAEFLVPSDFASTMTVAPIVRCASSGNVRWGMTIDSGAVDENWSTHDDDQAATTTSVTADVVRQLVPVSMASAAIGDYASVAFTRYGDNGADTLSADLILRGFLVTYTADS